jgi:acetyltransferase
MSVRNLDKLFKPRAVALIGATPRHGSLGAVLARNLRRGGFGGPLMLVNHLSGGSAACLFIPASRVIPASRACRRFRTSR